ncbi:MAG: hypothetical protein DME65_11895 [Verrucomicrobia bacterium]|jgi:hypothetical protein|nr:MAG: hypothetical protein DME65_11895 [Verrucomicrobiota bacterium]
MSDDDLIVVRDFLLKGMPWDLSRPRFMDFQREHIQDKTDGDPTFPARLRQVALETLMSEEPEIVCCALTALAFVGTRHDLALVEKFTNHNHSKISRFANTSLFEIRKADRAA